MATKQQTLSVRQYARERQISLNAVYQALWAGRLAAAKDERGEWRIPVSELERRNRAAAEEAVV